MASSSTTIRAAVAALAILAALVVSSGGPAAADEPRRFAFVYLQRAGDPAYEPHRAYTGLELRDRHRPVDGAALAVREARVLARVAGVEFALETVALGEGEAAVAAIDRMARDEGALAFLLDLPLDEVKRTAGELAGRELFLFNVRHDATALRGGHCSPVLFHTMPSVAMKTDALAQYLFERDWREILVLEGEEPEDRALAAAFRASARKFGLDIAEVRAFVLTNDPRLRDRSNIALLTGSADYDVVFLADRVGEFGRYVPYRTYLPRPVIGTEGLVSNAWHWTWERHGAPQLNQRFDEVAGRRMQDADWAAWAAVRALVEAVVRTKSVDYDALRAYLFSPDFTLDVYKGAPASFRPWNNQLRQNVLLHTHNAVVARAPLEGFLHERNTLDSLGEDARESRCRMER